MKLFRSRAIVALASVLALVARPGPASAQAQDPLAKGILQVEEGDFEGAIATLTPLAASLSQTGGALAARACLQLGVAHLALDQRDAARRRFREALDHQPDLRLSADRFSPKVLRAFEEARREREAARRAAGDEGNAGRALLLAAGGIAAGVGVALLAGGGSGSTSSGQLRFAAARFAPPVVDCPNESIGVPIPVGIDVEATNDGERAQAVTSVSSVLTIVESPAVPEEVDNTPLTAATVVTPATVPAGTTTLHVRTTLACSNVSGNPPRYNVWLGRVTLVTASGAATLETSDRLRVNIP